MTTPATDFFHDTLQVCNNGHVVTDRMRSNPELSRYHCERCGATTMHACVTCGRELAGAMIIPGLEPVGRVEPPLFCSLCGAAFPWSRRRSKAITPPKITLETFLRRLPATARALSDRWRTRPPFLIEDEHDLDDLVRSCLPLFFDEVRLRSRTPSYATEPRTEFLLDFATIVLLVKRVSHDIRRPHLERQFQEDLEFHRTSGECRHLWWYLFDSEQLLHEPQELERTWSRPEGQLETKCVASSYYAWQRWFQKQPP